jgi:hypothetical protein
LSLVKGDNPLTEPFFVEGADSADSWRASVEAAVLIVGRHSTDPAGFVVISDSRRIIQDVV